MYTTNTKVRTVSLHKKDVYFDADFLSLYYSETQAGDQPLKADRIATETQAEGGNRIIHRLCNHRVADLRQHIEKVLEEESMESSDDTLESGDWTFTIRISVEAEDNIFPTLADLFHGYVVNGALADWYAQLGVQGNRESLQMRADADLARIRELIYHRPMPTI